MLFFLLFRFFLEKTKPVLFYRIHLILYCPLPHSLFNIMEMKKWKICWWCFLCQSRLSIALECPSHICVCVCGRYKYIMEMVGIFVSIKWLILANCVIFITGISGRFSQTMHQFIIACGWPLYEDYGFMTMNTSSCNGNLITLILAMDGSSQFGLSIYFEPMRSSDTLAEVGMSGLCVVVTIAYRILYYHLK